MIVAANLGVQGNRLLRPSLSQHDLNRRATLHAQRAGTIGTT